MSTVLLVENQPITRQGLRERVTASGHQVVGEADNGQDALRMCRELQPEVVILELAIPRLGGLDVLRRLRASAPEIRLLVFSHQESEIYASRSQQEGADAFVSKFDPVVELEKAIAAIVHGRTYFPRQTSNPQTATSLAKELKDELRGLSARELTVLQMLCQGLSNKDISDHLKLSYKTVSTYKGRLHQKLGVSSDFQLIKVARVHGLEGVVDPSTSSGGFLEEQHEDLELLRAMLDSTPTSMFVRDLEGRLLLCNQAFLKRTQSSFEELRGTRIEEALWIPQELREQTANRFYEAVQQQEPFIFEIALEQQEVSGTYYVWGLPHRTKSGEMIAMVGGVRPLNERDSMLAELRHESLAAQFRSQQKNSILQLIKEDLDEQLQSLHDHSDMIVPSAASRELESCIAQLGIMSSRIEELLALEYEDATRQREARKLGPLTSSLLVPIRQRLAAAGYSLELDLGLSNLKTAWISVAQYKYLLESLFDHVQLQPPTHLSLRVEIRPHLKGYLRMSLELSPWPPFIPNDAKRAFKWSQTRVQRALGALSAYSVESEPSVEMPVALQIYIDVPLALES
ncbi:response regulator [Pseudomonas nitroreducens]|uniref:response regulator n=1 Tax=Pseudomonas nitroreducens TaxID=46680 RepID=UPI002D7E9FF0|nr:response regulator [Pseudomonas nitroreducens]